MSPIGDSIGTRIVGGTAKLRPDFSQAYDEHVWHVYGYLAYRVRTRAEAEDLTQVTFERALKAWDRFDRRKASVQTWLLVIARNALIDHQRREATRRQTSLSSDDLREVDLPSHAGPEHDLGMSPELASALDRLGERERLVLALRFGGDQSTAEIAAVLDLSIANVQQILSRTLRKLRTELGENRAGSPQPQP